MLYRTLCCVLLKQLALHDEMLRSVKEKAKSRQQLGAVVLGAMILGLGAFLGYLGDGLQGGSAMGSQETFAAWLAVLCGASGIAWVMASLLFSVGTHTGNDVVQPISYENFGKGGGADPASLDGCSALPDEAFYRALAGSCVKSLHSREREADRISRGASRSQSALFIGLAVAGTGAVAAFVALSGLWA